MTATAFIVAGLCGDARAAASVLTAIRRPLMPGISIRKDGADARPPRPLVKRCAAGCGRPVSLNKNRCKGCQDALLADLVEQIATQDLLDAVLDRSFAGDRRIMFDRLKPHLKFDAIWKE